MNFIATLGAKTNEASMENKMTDVVHERNFRVQLHLSFSVNAEIRLVASFNAEPVSAECPYENRLTAASTSATRLFPFGSAISFATNQMLSYC